MGKALESRESNRTYRATARRTVPRLWEGLQVRPGLASVPSDRAIRKDLSELALRRVVSFLVRGIFRLGFGVVGFGLFSTRLRVGVALARILHPDRCALAVARRRADRFVGTRFGRGTGDDPRHGGDE
jgi:hypothetical protein